jgi:hypothetical protein
MSADCPHAMECQMAGTSACHICRVEELTMLLRRSFALLVYAIYEGRAAPAPTFADWSQRNDVLSDVASALGERLP